MSQRDKRPKSKSNIKKDFIQLNKNNVRIKSEINKETRVDQPYFRMKKPKRDFYLELRNIRINSLKKLREVKSSNDVMEKKEKENMGK